MEHHGSTGTVAVCGNCGSCCTLLEIPSAGRLGSLGRGFHRQAEHRSSVAHLQNCGCLGVVVQVCLSAAFFTCCLWRLWWLAYGWHTLAARCPLGGLAVGHSEFCAVGSQLRQSPDELKDWSTSNGQHSGGCHSHAMAMHVSLLEGLKRPNWSQPKPKKSRTSSDYSFHIQRTIQSFQPRKSFLVRWAADSGREVDGGRIDHRETRYIFFEWALNDF
jgi:hypothetical protein